MPVPGYISEVSEGGGGISDFVEVVVPTGTDISSYSLVVYDPGGRVKDGPFRFPAPSTTVGGLDVYLFDDVTVGLGSFGLNEGIALIDNVGTVLQFISFDGNRITATEGPARGATSTNIGSHNSGESLQTVDGGASYFTQSGPNPGTVPCFAAGTLIATPTGPYPVEDLRPGDLVVTLDCGPMPVRVLRHHVSRRRHQSEQDVPVLIGAGAFGSGCPERDLVVSPQHRVLVGAVGQLAGSLDGEWLVPAKALCKLPRVRRKAEQRRVLWYHFALDTHALVSAEGCWTESLLLGRMVMPGLTGLQRQLLQFHFRDQSRQAALNGPPARPLLSVSEAAKKLDMVDRHLVTARA